jgi:ribosomal protein S12 methylthiotransferase
MTAARAKTAKASPEPAATRRSGAPVPKVGFVSLGCPKALVDSERILTQLRAEGYRVAPTYEDADLVVINTCGFIEAAIDESLAAIGEALDANGKVIVTGCPGAKGDIVRKTHPTVLAVTGPHATDEVVRAVHEHLPRPHDPYTSLIPPRPIGELMQEAENLVKAGVKELLVISQDTSAYGVDVKFRTGFWRGRPLKTRMTEFARALAELGAWVRLHYLYPYPHVVEVVLLMGRRAGSCRISTCRFSIPARASSS